MIYTILILKKIWKMEFYIKLVRGGKVMKYIKEKLTFTNTLIIVATIIYILNVFIISSNTGSMSLKIIESFEVEGIKMPNTIVFKILGVWGGHLNDLLGFNINKIFSGEIWRIYTVIWFFSKLVESSRSVWYNYTRMRSGIKWI